MQIHLNPSSIESYKLFLQIKALPRYRIAGRVASFPDEYASRLGLLTKQPRSRVYKPIDGLFDYQFAITTLAIRKKKFAIFAACGLGKTLMLTEYARHVASVLPRNLCVLIVSPLMVVRQTLDEIRRFYGERLSIEQVSAKNLDAWLRIGESRIGITNYEAITPALQAGRLGSLILDESSMLKSHYGKWGTKLIDLGRGLDYKLCATGTPAPNDRIEYANHAVFLDAFPTVNSFLARFFVNRGQTCERWELKPHALRAFYLALSHWCIFLENPGTYGWKSNTDSIPPIHVTIHDVELTDEQQELVYAKGMDLFASNIGGITNRTALAQIAKGHHKGVRVPTKKFEYIKKLVESWPEESTIVWCNENNEQDDMERIFPEAASIRGSTPYSEREKLIADFKSGKRRQMISKDKVLGFGLNLQVATRQVFPGLKDSFEKFHQCVKRSNRIGSTRPLNVHLVTSEVERPMIETVLRKAKRVQEDTEVQERLFKECGACLVK